MKRALVLVLSLLTCGIFAMTLIGCGAADDTAAAPTTPAQETAAAPTAPAQGTAASPTTPAQEPTSITVYTALEDDQIVEYLTTFKAAHPNIEVDIVRESTGIITARLLAEKDNPQADVVWGVAASSLLVLDGQNMLEPYAPRNLEQVKPQFRCENNPPSWVGINAWMTAFTVNTVETDRLGIPIPRTYQDLLDPRFEGLIVMPDPTASGTGFLTVSGWLQSMGWEEGWQFMADLDRNIAMYVDSGSKPARMAAAGETVIGISFCYRGITLKADGAPVEVVFPEEGSGWDIEANALMKKDEIKPEAKLFLDWAISKDAMNAYFKSYPITSVPVDQPIPAGYPADPLAQLLPNDLQWAAEHREEVLAEWTDRFAGRTQQ